MHTKLKAKLLLAKNVMVGYSSSEIKILLNLFIIVTAVLIFTGIATKVVRGDTQKFDLLVLNYLRDDANVKTPIAPPWFTLMMNDITLLGGTTVIFLITAVVSFYLVMRKQYRFLLLILAATIGGAIFSLGLKELFARERPPLEFHLLTVKSLSFPSGHAIMSSVVYLTQGALLAKIQTNKNLKAFILLIAIALVFLIGISRIYFGVHYPTDVLAGWSVGLAWASFCWLIANYIQRKIEQK